MYIFKTNLGYLKSIRNCEITFGDKQDAKEYSSSYISILKDYLLIKILSTPGVTECNICQKI